MTNCCFNPKQSRPVDAYRQKSKLLNRRCEGISQKFKAGNNVTEFKNSLFEAFIERVLDTIHICLIYPHSRMIQSIQRCSVLLNIAPVSA
jgi:hypothetical protein